MANCTGISVTLDSAGQLNTAHYLVFYFALAWELSRLVEPFVCCTKGEHD